ncbi:MAG: hypothetical protein JXR07_03890 [Reichenbachiella sp.]
MSIYYKLGGFEDPIFGSAKDPYYSVTGKWLNGDVSKKEEGLLFNEMRDLIALDKIDGVLCMVNYKSDTLAEHEINRFVGIKLESEFSGIPNGFEVIELKAPYAYQAALTMHPLVMPNSKKIEDQLKLMAEENEDVLRPLTMEWYYSDNSVMIQMLTE